VDQIHMEAAPHCHLPHDPRNRAAHLFNPHTDSNPSGRFTGHRPPAVLWAKLGTYDTRFHAGGKNAAFSREVRFNRMGRCHFGLADMAEAMKVPSAKMWQKETGKLRTCP
jgi:hypothetical protein